jgi:hypothetical protein
MLPKPGSWSHSFLCLQDEQAHWGTGKSHARLRMKWSQSTESSRPLLSKHNDYSHFSLFHSSIMKPCPYSTNHYLYHEEKLCKMVQHFVSDNDSSATGHIPPVPPIENPTKYDRQEERKR